MALTRTLEIDNGECPIEQKRKKKQGRCGIESQVAVTSCTSSSLRTKTSDLQADIRDAGSSPTQQEYKGKQQTAVTTRPQLAEILPLQWISQKKNSCCRLHKYTFQQHEVGGKHSFLEPPCPDFKDKVCFITI